MDTVWIKHKTVRLQEAMEFAQIAPRGLNWLDMSVWTKVLKSMPAYYLMLMVTVSNAKEDIQIIQVTAY